MITISEMIQQANIDGYVDENAEAKVCQDVVLKALSESDLSHNATIKGGVVMRSISHNVRRATQDLDIDFIRYSLNDDSIQLFIQKLNCLDGIHIQQTGEIVELKQQDYHGKRIYIIISDDTGDYIESKIDLGVHKNLSIEQEEYCFDIACDDEGANLLINTKEQMFVEKLKSLLIFGPNSTRFKDVFDMCYLSDLINRDNILICLDIFIFSDLGMRENNMQDVLQRVAYTFASDRYINRLSNSRKNWLGMDIDDVIEKIVSFLEIL